MASKQYMTLQDHLDTAKDLAEAIAALRRAWSRVYNGGCRRFLLVREGRRAGDILFKMIGMRGDLSMVRSLLDSEYHRLITDEQFREFGHTYYKESEASASVTGPPSS